MGITTHWVESHMKGAGWSLASEVIAFRAISGPHTGVNLSRYLVSLCERAGIITSGSTKVCPMKFSLFSNYSTLSCQLFCVTTDNTSNNDTACSAIQNILFRKHIYSFDSDAQRLPCLAHVVNLAITNFMSAITNIASVETTSAIWEFDPSVSMNHIPGDSLDVVSAVQMLAIKIQASGQRIAYFERLQTECGITVPLTIPLHSNVRWGTADGMLGCAYR